MNKKTNHFVKGVAAAVPALLVIASGIFKLTSAPPVIDKLQQVGMQSYIPLLAAMEILFAGLYFFRRTMKAGLLLLSCYFGGAIATDLSHSENFMSAAIILLIVWIAAFVRDKYIFLYTGKKQAIV